DDEAAAQLARETYPRMAKTPSSANVASIGLSAALELPAENPHRAELVAATLADCREVAADSTLPIASDDRSGVYLTLIDERKLGILRTRSDIYKGRGDLASARSTVEEALHEAEALPPGQHSDASVASLRKQLEGFAGTAAK